MIFGKKPEVMGETPDDASKARTPLRPLPTPIADIPTKYPSRKSNGIQAIIVVIFLASIFALIVPVSIYHPFHGWECGVYLSIPLLPLLALSYMPVQRFMAARLPAKKDAGLPLLLLLPLLFIPMGAEFYVNGRFDTSAPETATFTVIDKGWTSSKSGRHYYAYINSPEPSPLPFSFSAHQSLGITHGSYDRIIPNASHVTLAIHQGFLGLPWFDHVNFSDLAN